MAQLMSNFVAVKQTRKKTAADLTETRFNKLPFGREWEGGAGVRWRGCFEAKTSLKTRAD